MSHNDPEPEAANLHKQRLGGNRFIQDSSTIEKTASSATALLGVRAKIARADEHLRSIGRLDEEFETVNCEAVFTEDRERNLGYFFIHLPDPPLELSAIVGDCLSNLRSALDYLVGQVVLSNPPHKPGRQTMFPICSSQATFEAQLKRGRLVGVPSHALAVIQGVQPFESPHHPLALLDELCNADKHRDLHFTTSVASDLAVSFSRNGQVYFQMVLGNDDVRNGAILGGVGIDLTQAQPLPHVQVHGEARAFVAFRDLFDEWEDPLPVTATLYEIRTFVADEVLSPLAAFVN